MTYNMNATAGAIQIPSGTTIKYKTLDLVGRDSKDWNEPIQQNFVTLVDKVDVDVAAEGQRVEGIINAKVKTDVPVDAKFTDTVYDDTTVKSDIANKVNASDIGSIADFNGAFANAL